MIETNFVEMPSPGRRGDVGREADARDSADVAFELRLLLGWGRRHVPQPDSVIAAADSQGPAARGEVDGIVHAAAHRPLGDDAAVGIRQPSPLVDRADEPAG